MDDDESAWDKDEVIEFTEERVFPALSFLEEQAERWGVNLSFEVKRYFTALSEGLDMTYKGTVIKDLLFRARPRTCLSRPLRFWALLRAWSCSRRLWGIRNDKLIPLMLIDKNVASYALGVPSKLSVIWSAPSFSSIIWDTNGKLVLEWICYNHSRNFAFVRRRGLL